MGTNGGLNERFMKTVGPHFVTLSCVQTPVSASEAKIFVFSGFIVNIKGLWFYITAGHILRDLQTSIGKGDTFDVWRLGDQTAGNNFKGTAIPYDFDIAKWMVIEDKEIGLDYAAVVLSEMECRQLQAGNVVAIEQFVWGNYVDHDQWALVGIPRDTVKYDGKTVITARVVMVPIVPTDTPQTAGKKAENQFYGRLSSDSVSVLKDVDGMSGGPIFALKRINGLMKYWLIGIQSAWYREQRIIAGCPFSSLGIELETIVGEVLSHQPNS